MLGDAFLHQLPHAFGTILIVIYSFAYQKNDFDCDNTSIA